MFLTAVRLSRQTGNGQLLWPEDCTTLEEVPADLLRTIAYANKILDWHENLTEEEVPPEWMWPFEDDLKEWFDEVKAARNDRYGGSSSSDETVEMMSNEFSRSRG